MAAALVLAAGGGSRFGSRPGAKLLAQVRGRPLVEHAVLAARASGLPVLLVWGSVDLRPTAEALGVEAVHSERWAEGIATSLQAGVAAARGAGHEAVVVGLGDQPGVPAEAWAAVAASAWPVAVATYGGRRGNPVRLAAEVWPLLPVTGDEGGRVLVRGRPDLVGEVPCPGDPADVDTVEDLARWS